MRDTINILLIEDDEDDFLIVRDLLTKARGLQFVVHWASRLEDGFRELDSKSIDVILLDFTLPDSTGIQTFTRTLARAPHVPIVALTGFDDETMAVMAVQKGAQDYLVKGGLGTDRLVSSIRYAIERKRTETILNRYRDHLEELVRERTAKLTEINVKLEGEITERKEVEVRLRRAIARLEEHDRAKTEFVSNVSHELKTPLSSMLYASENLLKGVVGPFPEAASSYIEMSLLQNPPRHCA